MIYIGYVNFVVVLLIATGILILRFDVNGYRMAEMKKEQKVARILGWVNIGLGIIFFLVHWGYNTFIYIIWLS